MSYRIVDVQNYFKTSSQTVRRWSEEFDEYLSPNTDPRQGKARIFTDEDMRVFALIASMKHDSKVFKEIHFALSLGERGDIEETRKKLKVVDMAGIPKEIMIQRMTAMQEELELLISEKKEYELQQFNNDKEKAVNQHIIEDLRTQLKDVTEKYEERETKREQAYTQREQELEQQYRQQIKDRDDELKKLYRELGGQEALNKMLRQNQNGNDED